MNDLEQIEEILGGAYALNCVVCGDPLPWYVDSLRPTGPVLRPKFLYYHNTKEKDCWRGTLTTGALEKNYPERTALIARWHRNEITLVIGPIDTTEDN